VNIGDRLQGGLFAPKELARNVVLHRRVEVCFLAVGVLMNFGVVGNRMEEEVMLESLQQFPQSRRLQQSALLGIDQIDISPNQLI
jgi:hypothetical protein